MAGRKAFIVTRVGDTALVIGLFLLFHESGHIEYSGTHAAGLATLADRAPALRLRPRCCCWAARSESRRSCRCRRGFRMPWPARLRSARLIHAATMVTAGVYLIARTHVLFSLAPQAQFAVAVIGAATLLIAGFSALTQWDLKRVLAYSTISQIGYMFLALGVGAWPAAIFHFMTHAFFKALLFLGAGIVIKSLDEEHNIFRMGGLRKQLPVAFWTFLIAGCSLAGLPLITAGAFSKDWIVWGAWSAANGSAGLWIVALAGVLLTSLYTFRMIFLVFFGEAHSQVTKRAGQRDATFPAWYSAFLSITGGYVEDAHSHDFWRQFFPGMPRDFHAAPITEIASEGIAAWCFCWACPLPTSFSCASEPMPTMLASSAVGGVLHRFWFSDWGMDWLYDRLFVRPLVWLARVDKDDFIDGFYTGVARVNEIAWRVLRRTETGKLRWYAAGIAAGSIVFIAVVLFL